MFQTEVSVSPDNLSPRASQSATAASACCRAISFEGPSPPPCSDGAGGSAYGGGMMISPRFHLPVASSLFVLTPHLFVAPQQQNMYVHAHAYMQQHRMQFKAAYPPERWPAAWPTAPLSAPPQNGGPAAARHPACVREDSTPALHLRRCQWLMRTATRAWQGACRRDWLLQMSFMHCGGVKASSAHIVLQRACAAMLIASWRAMSSKLSN